jgi:predicted adenylyl cyclase CyaB
MPYEVERRANFNLKDNLPKESALERIYGGRDYYYNIDPFLRVRDLKITHPSEKTIQKMSLKKYTDGEIEEIETDVNARIARRILDETIGKPKVIVEAQREEYSHGGSRICVDEVKDLGSWTEVELMVGNREEIPKALDRVEKTFESMGVEKDQLVSDIYPILLLKNYGRL